MTTSSTYSVTLSYFQVTIDQIWKLDVIRVKLLIVAHNNFTLGKSSPRVYLTEYQLSLEYSGAKEPVHLITIQWYFNAYRLLSRNARLQILFSCTPVTGGSVELTAQVKIS